MQDLHGVYFFFFSVSLLIDRLHQDHTIHNKAVLLAIRPLKIGKKATLKRFIQYVPPPE